jgi:hypothetical protein
MKRIFKIEKLPLEALINLLIELYENGADYVDLASDSTDPHQDRLIIQTKNDYLNAQFKNREDDEQPTRRKALPPSSDTLDEDKLDDLI